MIDSGTPKRETATYDKGGKTGVFAETIRGEESHSSLKTCAAASATQKGLHALAGHHRGHKTRAGMVQTGNPGTCVAYRTQTKGARFPINSDCRPMAETASNP